MDLFVYNPTFSLAICRECQFAVVANEVTTHLNTRHRSLPAAERKKIAEAVQQCPGIMKSQGNLALLQLPEPTTSPIKYLAPPQSDGLKCITCTFVCRRLEVMQRHCRDDHGWKNDWKKGGDVKRKAAKAKNIAWVEGVSCQRFFPTRAGRRWFHQLHGKALPLQIHTLQQLPRQLRGHC
ncbi:hypothetical protein LY78DRAFT_730082 [Colletotrichum sublineola]|nr:hypothetical protein LY78DRAFT_730082 [Colletotrichum sublineola]